MSPLTESIKNTLCYFGLFNYPLTKEELFAYLWKSPRLGYDEFIQTGLGQIREKDSYLMLNSDDRISDDRRRRLVICEQKITIAKKAIKKIRSVPFVRAVFVCNSVGSGLASEGSDIDFFIIAAPGRIWLVRFFTNFILKIFGLRTYGKNHQDKICLSFFVDEKHLNLRPYCALKDDVHFIYWTHQMIPVFDPKRLYESFLLANRWTEEYLPNIRRISGADYLTAIAESKIGRGWRLLWENMWQGEYGNLIERQAKQFQLVRLKMSLKETSTRGDNSVIIEDGILKFHENDSRKEIYNKWQLCLQKSQIG